jgi:hypothetical protein
MWCAGGHGHGHDSSDDTDDDDDDDDDDEEEGGSGAVGASVVAERDDMQRTMPVVITCGMCLQLHVHVHVCNKLCLKPLELHTLCVATRRAPLLWTVAELPRDVHRLRCRDSAID